MRIDCIGATTFGNTKSTTLQKALPLAAGAVAGTVTFVKGLSTPTKEVDEFIKVNDDMDYSCCDDSNPDECCGWDYSACND